MTYDEVVKEVLLEVLQRTRRTETKVTALAKGLNIEVMNGEDKVRLLQEDAKIVEVSGRDVSFSDVIAFCRRSGISGIMTVSHNGKILGSVMIDPLPPDVAIPAKWETTV